MKKININISNSILTLPRNAKKFIVLSIDVCFCVISVPLAFYLRLGEFVILIGNALVPVLASIFIALPIFVVSGLYRTIFRYSDWPALLAVARAVGVYGLIYAAIFTVSGVPDVPRTIGIIQPILLLLFVGASRAFARAWLGNQYQAIVKRSERPKVLIYGAGQAGMQLAAGLANSHEMQVVGFLDDDDRLHRHVLNGLRIYNPADLGPLVENKNIKIVLLAMPAIDRKRRNEILTMMREARVAVRTLPSFTDLAQGKVSTSDIRDLDIDDLLGREPVTPNYILLAKNIVNKIVLVTGAGGSIGSELCRQIMRVGPAKLLLIEQSEFALYKIHQELEQKFTERENILVPLLASIQDIQRMQEICSTWQPETVYHTAAYKHVPLVEHNPAEGVKNNVFGTLATARAAIQSGVKDFVLISTDKAVRPTNMMGASKRLAEMVLQALSDTQNLTRFTMVRFGNVLGSSGSVVPKFRQQIRDGGPVTLTHPNITRYFMTIPEAAQLVLQAGAMAKGGDVFVLDMGQPVKIYDLVHKMIGLSGLTLKDEGHPEGDIEIEITGLRPGEKLFEELLIGDNPLPTLHPRIMKASEDFIHWSKLEEHFKALDVALGANDVNVIRAIMQDLVRGYQPSGEIVDWVYLEQDNGIGAA